MHFITAVEYEAGHRLILTFENGARRMVDLTTHLDGEVFEPLRDIKQFQTARLNKDIDTVVWENGADMSPDFLYDIGEPVDDAPPCKVAEGRAEYGCKDNDWGSAKEE